MRYKEFIYTGETKFAHKGFLTDAHPGLKDKEAGRQLLQDNRETIAQLQNALYAEDTQSLLVIFQAMDAAGKDGTIRHVFTGVNPQGVQVTSFKPPSAAELDRDYLWRVHQAVPQRGHIGIFNRSHYEDVLIGRVLDLPGQAALPARSRKDIWKNRYRQIRDFERYLYENGATILKLYLCVSREEQRERFASRMMEPEKKWKFSKSDLETSARWPDYMDAYEKSIAETATPYAPWCVIPADRKWYARALVSEIVKKTLQGMKPAYPKPTEQQRQDMEAYRESLGAAEGETGSNYV